ncbi:MAG: GGGtGRT protein, partial [Clostridia bacterium]|nr:GGGtGRT protein [Clostridia bacterium]
MEITFEGIERRITSIKSCLEKNGIKDLSEAKKICNEKNINPEKIVRSVQPIAFENAVWAYTLGCALAIKNSAKNPCD